ncbi:MAG TPA: TonB-dependent receptor [Vicinamibacteria bacterium]
MRRFLLALAAVGALLPAAAYAQTTETTKAAEKKDDSDVVTREEVVVVSASKVETTLVNAPATLSVVTADTIASSPAQNFGDLLRSTPGINVIQTSARDINMTSRAATSTLVNSQLVLLDGRSIYLDFFGLVLWDFVPQNQSEIKQIEVVRGPASAVWGANALTGVVNIITKSPRETEGFTLNLQGGLINRDGGSQEANGSGYSYGANFSFAQAPSDKLSWRLSAGYFNSDPYSRPTGTVPAGTHPLDSSVKTGGATYPEDRPGVGGFPNSGTSQPKVDLRVDREFPDSGGRLTFQGGYAGTTGIIHTGLGPFDIQSPSYMTYGKTMYSKGALKASFFANIVDVGAPNLLLPDPNSPTLDPLQLNFKTKTFDFELGHSTVLGGKHILSYGGNFRRNQFDIVIAPAAEDRSEYGAYFQEEFFLDKFRVAAGLRVDKFGNLDKAVLSPRLSVMVKPTPSQSIRASFNRAFRSPSVINNYLDLGILNTSQALNFAPLAPLLPAALRPLVPPAFFLQVRGFGNPDLKEESIDALELAYTGTIAGRTTLGIALYQNTQDDNINFVNLRELPAATGVANGLTLYSPANPAKGVTVVNPRPITVHPLIMTALGQVPAQFGGPIRLPENVFTYLNLGPIRNRGVELSIEHTFNREWSGFANYSYQDTPETLDADSDQIPYPINEVGVPAKNRVNLGLNWTGKRFLGSATLNYSDKAFWNDVLDGPYHGTTDAYTMVNANFGVKFADGKYQASIKGTNLTNSKIQQHIFGDIIKMSLSAELRIFVK